MLIQDRGIIYKKFWTNASWKNKNCYVRYCGQISFYKEMSLIINKLYKFRKKLQSFNDSSDVINFYAMSRLYKWRLYKHQDKITKQTNKQTNNNNNSKTKQNKKIDSCIKYMRVEGRCVGEIRLSILVLGLSSRRQEKSEFLLCSFGGFAMWLNTRMNFTNVYIASKLIFPSTNQRILYIMINLHSSHWVPKIVVLVK